MLLREVTFEDYTKIKKLVTRSKKNIQDYETWKKIWSTNPLLKEGYKIEFNNSMQNLNASS